MVDLDVQGCDAFGFGKQGKVSGLSVGVSQKVEPMIFSANFALSCFWSSLDMFTRPEDTETGVTGRIAAAAAAAGGTDCTASRT